MTETKNNPETSNQTELPHNPATNEEILALLRQLVGQDSNTNEQNLEASPEDAENDNEDDVENHEAVGKLGEEEDDYTDDDLETVGYIVGGAALVGAGALLYHLLRKL